MKKDEIILGVDIGGTNTAMGFVERNGKVLWEKTIDTKSEQGADNLFSRIKKLTKSSLKNLEDQYQLIGIGVGAPNVNYYSGVIEHAPNLNWKHVHVIDTVQHHFDLPVFANNDANASAIGERLFGAAKGMKDFVVITLGTGLGSGIVVNGEVVYGADGFAGEMGHACVIPEGRDCHCGNKGCLETYVSATGIKRTVFELLAKRTEKSVLRDISYNDLRAKRISEAAKADDPIAAKAFDFTGMMLGIGLTNIVSFSRPEAIIILGGLASAGELLLKPTKRYMDQYLLPVYRGKIKVLQSGLGNGNVAILGAAALAWEGLGTN